MSNFEKQLNAAINEYSELTGLSRSEILIQCKNFNSQTARNVRMITGVIK